MPHAREKDVTDKDFSSSVSHTPKWEFNGEFLVHFGSALTPKGREDVLRMLETCDEVVAAFSGKCPLCKKNGYVNDHSATCPYDDAQRAALSKAEKGA